MQKQTTCTVTAPLTLDDLAAVGGGMPSRGYTPSEYRPTYTDRALDYARENPARVVEAGRQVRDAYRGWRDYSGLSGRETVGALLNPWGKRE